MGNLKALTLTAAAKSRPRDPISVRRERVRMRLDEQKRLFEDPTYIRTAQRWITIDGEKKLISKQIRVSPWWWVDANGQLLMTVKVGGRAVEFEKGKAAIAVHSREHLPAVIDILIKAVDAGELDTALQASAKARMTSKPRKTA